jgi:predicted NBD/HSP70 family sugar kinase
MSSPSGAARAHDRVSDRSAPGSATALRAANQRRVIRALMARGELTQASLVRETGLAAGTVSSIVRELAAAEVLATVAGSGRRGTSVRLARGAGLVAGVDFGHSHVAVAVADMTGEVLAEAREPLPAEYGERTGLDRAGRLLDRVLAQIGAPRAALRNLGMGLPAPISHGVVLSTAILPGWVGLDARAAARDRLDVPVYIDNDANLGALGEHRYGAGRRHADVVFAKVSSGVGAGLIVNNQLYRGTDGTAGEIGHLTLDEQGPLCRCGSRGCLEAYASSGHALEMVAAQMPGATIDEMIAAAKAGNVAARRVFEDAGLHLGWGLAAVTNLLNPGVITVGGDMSHAGDLLLDATRSGLRRHVLAGAASTPVVVAELGDRASMVGALVLAIEATDLVPEPV